MTVTDPVLFEEERSGDHPTLRLRGAWCIDNLPEMESALAQLDADRRHSRLDLSGIETLDLSGAWLLRNWLERCKSAGARMTVVGDRPEHFAFLDELLEQRGGKATAGAEPGPASLRDAIGWIGRGAVQQAKQTRDAIGFFGRIAATLVRAMRSAHHLRLPSIARHIYETGIQAIPIVSLIAFLISVIVAYLGAQQLRTFGAEIFTVDLVAISVLREMGVLLTSIIVAGRSGSAFAAEIGVMRLNDEIDALQSMGVDFYEVLVLPRLIGLLVALPLLTIIADAMGLAGGALLSSLLLDISLSQFIPRVQDALAPTTFWAGLVKAPVFAMLIALVGTYRGMQVRDSSRELGRLTTVAVVQSIFLVIFADAIFAIVFVELDF